MQAFSIEIGKHPQNPDTHSLVTVATPSGRVFKTTWGYTADMMTRWVIPSAFEECWRSLYPGDFEASG